MQGKLRFIGSLLLFFCFGSLFSQELMIYPNEGQDKGRQELDEFQCYGWAKDRSSFDPMAVPTASRPPPEQQAQKGGLVRGAAGGAAVGAIIDVGDGAATGALRRNSQRRGQAQKQHNWEQQQAQEYAAKRNGYNRAYAACLDGRG